MDEEDLGVDSKRRKTSSRKTSKEMGGRVRGKGGPVEKSTGNDFWKRNRYSPTATGTKNSNILYDVGETTKRMDEVLWPEQLVKTGHLSTK